MQDRVICCEDERGPHSENETQEGSSEAAWVEVCSTKVTRRKKLVSRSAALLKVKTFKLVVSQQELEIKSTWQEAEAMREFWVTNNMHLTLAILTAQK